MVADSWKSESDEVKDRFKQQYKDEMIQYEIAKKLSRYQSSVIPKDYLDEDGLSYVGLMVELLRLEKTGQGMVVDSWDM
ncbi:hypothetical protein GGI03_000721 [Coemansia sp. RSA 2337]|nr:hypothetical protein GGI03_000721 [Coemansia sp. RSA 2337]